MTEKETKPESGNLYKKLPKVDLHRHLEGSLRVRTMMEIVRAHNLDVKNTGYLRPLVQMDHQEAYTFENFLAKFGTLRLFYRSPDIIKRISREAVEDAAEDGVRYLELRFTPVALSRAEGFPVAQVVEWVIESVREAAESSGINVGLIASVNRHESLELAQEVVQVAAAYKDQGVLGLDLAGNEAEYSGAVFRELFAQARQEGLHITVHAGEWGGAENVREAIEVLGAERIGHGIRVIEDPKVVSLARERGTLFEVCVTSNLHSGVVNSLKDHPLMAMVMEGLNVTINTDDPSISKINLSGEYRAAVELLGLPLPVLQERVLAAAQGSFLHPGQKQQLAYQLSQEFGEILLS
jgi:adenosine deaminase